jgi:hypothetical protein
VLPDLTPSFPGVGVSGHAGAVHWRRALESMCRTGPSVIGTCDAPDRRLFFSGPGGLVTPPPQRVAPPFGPSLPSRPDPPCGVREDSSSPGLGSTLGTLVSSTSSVSVRGAYPALVLRLARHLKGLLRRNSSADQLSTHLDYRVLDGDGVRLARLDEARGPLAGAENQPERCRGDSVRNDKGATAGSRHPAGTHRRSTRRPWAPRARRWPSTATRGRRPADQMS